MGELRAIVEEKTSLLDAWSVCWKQIIERGTVNRERGTMNRERGTDYREGNNEQREGNKG